MQTVEEIVRICQALGQDTRFKILKVLSRGTFCVCELEEILGISQPAISHHLTILKDAGLVLDSREGQWVFYRANSEHLEEFWQALSSILAMPIDELQGMDEIAARVKHIEANPKAPRECRRM